MSTVNIVRYRYVSGRLKAPGRPDIVPQLPTKQDSGGDIGDGFILGVTKPNSTKYVGVPIGWVPARTITTDTIIGSGQTFTDVRFACKVDVKGYGNRFVRCHFVGPSVAGWEGTGRPIVRMTDAAVKGPTQNYFSRCTFKPQTPSDRTDNFQGFNYWFDRCDFSGAVDGFDSYIPVAVGNVCNGRVDGCWIHDHAFYAPTDTHSDNRSHNDPIQFQNGDNVVVTGTFWSGLWDKSIGDGNVPGVLNADGTLKAGNPNDFYDPPGSAGPQKGLAFCNSQMQFNTPAGGSLNDIHFRNSWGEGGATAFNIISAPNITILELTNVVFDTPMYGKNQIIRALNSTAKVQVLGCTYLDGSPMPGTVGAGRYNNS